MINMTDKLFDYKIQQGFLWSEVNLKGDKKYYVEGYASTIDEDKAGEIVNIKAQQDMLEQIQSQNITLDVEHSEWYDDAGNVLNKPKNTTIPVAKVVSAELRERGVWIKAEINRNIPSFRSVWNSIKEGFLKAFSVAFYPVAKAGKEISKLNLVNITLTGSPVNPNATFNVAMKSAKAFLDQQRQEENIMAEQEKIETQPEIKAEEEVKQPEPVVEEKVEEPVVEEESKPEEPKPEVKSEPNPLEAEVKALKEEVAKLKAELDKPVMKAVKEEAPEIPVEEQRFISPLTLI